MERSAEQVRENYKRITDRIGEAMAKYRKPEEQVQLMAVTKTVDPALVNVAVECGVRLLGENRVQEYESKKAQYDPRAQVQFIGQLQTNKVKYVVGRACLIHMHRRNERKRMPARAVFTSSAPSFMCLSSRAPKRFCVAEVSGAWMVTMSYFASRSFKLV